MPHARSVMLWTVALLVAAPQFVSVAPVPNVTAETRVPVPARPAATPDGDLGRAPLERLAAAAFADAHNAEPRPLRPVRWTELRETVSGRPRPKSVFDPDAWTPTTAASSSMDIGAWTAPQWAEPEADAHAHLALLRYLPAQPPASGRVSSFFGPRRTPHGDAVGGQLRLHAGLDIAVPTGTPVVAPGPGIVVGVGYGPQFGRYVRILHEHVGLETLLAHLSSIEPSLRRGVRVRRGQLVGRSGNSGLSTGPHLHYEFRTVWKQRPVDPLQVYRLYFEALDRAANFPIASTHAHLPPYRIEGGLWNSNSDHGPQRPSSRFRLSGL